MDEQANMNMPQGGGSKGSLIGIIIIILIIILGGLYFWSQRSDTVETTNDQAAGDTFEAGSEDAETPDTDLDMEVDTQINAS